MTVPGRTSPRRLKSIRHSLTFTAIMRRPSTRREHRPGHSGPCHVDGERAEEFRTCHDGRPVALFQGRFREASVDLSHALELRDDTTAMLFRYLASARSGRKEEALAESAESLNASGFRVWPYAFIELYLGKRSPEEMLTAAEKVSDRCLAQFHVGEWHALRRKFREAVAALNAAAEYAGRIQQNTGRPPRNWRA